MLAKHLSALAVVAEDGISYDLYSSNNPAVLLFLDGAGMATVRRINQRTPLQNGVVDKGFRLEPRKMTLGLFINQQNERDVDTMRDKLAYIFGPTNFPLRLRATRLDGAVRAIDCFVDGTMDFPQSERMGASQKVLIPLYAPDPTFYDPTQVVSTTSLTTTPVSSSLFLSAGVTADDWLIFKVTGPVTDLAITHQPLGDAISFAGTTIPAGETWVIDLRPGYKTVYRQSDNTNRLYAVFVTSVVFMSTMRVYSQKVAASLGLNGNYFSMTGSGTTAASSIQFLFYKRYLSL